MPDSSTNLIDEKSNPMAAAQYYARMGLDAIPLLPDSKKAIMLDWPVRSPSDMWKGARPNSNVGLRAGGLSKFAILDLDEKNKVGTCESGLKWLEGLGYHSGDFPLIQTASGIGRQVYVTLVGDLPGNHIRKFRDDFGAGEFRYGPGAYVVAPPSTVSGRAYKLLAGEIARRPILDAQEVMQILKRVTDVVRAPEPHAICHEDRIPRHTLYLLTGGGREAYETRSEVEQAILTGLVNGGFELDTVLELFLRHPCGGRFREDYASNPKQAINWLTRSYQSALEFASANESPAHQSATLAVKWAETRPWPGRGGQYDKLAFIAHATVAYRAGCYVYAASARDLADLAGISPEASMHATARLRRHGLIRLVQRWDSECANVYQLVYQSSTLPHNGGEGSVKL